VIRTQGGALGEVVSGGNFCQSVPAATPREEKGRHDAAGTPMTTTGIKKILRKLRWNRNSGGGGSSASHQEAGGINSHAPFCAGGGVFVRHCPRARRNGKDIMAGPKKKKIAGGGRKRQKKNKRR